MLAQGSVGPIVASDGTTPAAGIRVGKSGEVVVQELHGRYYEQVYRGNMWSAANQAAQAISVALATTYTGLLLYNPPNSGVNLVPNKVKFALTVAPAAIASLGLIAGFAATGGVTAQTTKLVPQNNFLNTQASPHGIALAAATIVTPTWLLPLSDGFTAAAFPAPLLPFDLEGCFIVPPGAFIGIGALTAVTGLGGISWEEVPV